jgi:hypothetical protein
MRKFRVLIGLLVLFTGSMFLVSCESNDMTVYPTGSSTPPLTLLQPLNNSTLNTSAPSFDWADLPGAVSYGLQVSTDASFSNVVVNMDALSSSSAQLDSGALNDSTSYYWRVRGVTQSDTTDWTGSSSFSVLLGIVSSNNKVLIEMFTNTSCIPCVPANTYLDRIHNLEGVTNNDAEVVLIRIHSTLYPNDPFYLFNTAANDARQNYYNGGVFNPMAFLNGTFMSNYNANTWTGLINNAFGSLSSFAIGYNNSYDAGSRSGTVSVNAHMLSGSQVSDLVLHVALTEDGLLYNAPNGETHFENVLRDLITPGGGQSVSVSPGQPASFTFNYSVNSQINDQNASLVMFLQSVSTKKVYAVEYRKIR